MKIAIYGAGSLGTIIGALLSKAGKDVDLIDVNIAHVNALNEKGARIVGHMELTQPVKAICPDDMKEPYDYMFYLTKPTQNEVALPHLARYLKPDGIVIACQNGLPEKAIAQVVGETRVVGCVIGWGATWMEPGVSKLTTPTDHMTFTLGTLDNQITDRVRAVEEMLHDVGIAQIAPDFIGGRWGKLIINCTFSAMGAIVNGTFGDVIDNPKAIRSAAFIYNEMMAIANAAGIKPISLDFAGFDYNMLTFQTEQELEAKIPVFEFMAEPYRDIKTQILFDIEAGRYPEIDTTFNGIILNWGERYGVPTPVNRQVVEMIREMADGKLKLSATNVDRITLPELP